MTRVQLYVREPLGFPGPGFTTTMLDSLNLISHTYTLQLGTAVRICDFTYQRSLSLVSLILAPPYTMQSRCKHS